MDSKKIVRVGVIGCGMIAQIMHLPYLNELPEFELYSLCDISHYVVEQLGKRYGLSTDRLYTDVDKMLSDPMLDAVIISTNEHYKPAIKAAKSGKHLLIEKPIAYTMKQAQEIVQTAKNCKVVLMIGYMKRYDPGYIYALEHIRKLKEVNFVRVHDFAGSFVGTRAMYHLFSAAEDVPAAELKHLKDEITSYQIEEIGNTFSPYVRAYDQICGLACHDLVLLRHAFGMPRLLFSDVHKDTFTTAVLDYGDFRCTLESAMMMDRRHWDEIFSVYSGEKNIHVHFPHPYLKNAATTVEINENEPDTMINVNKDVIVSYDESYRNELRHFYECIVENKEPLTSGEDALLDLQLAGDIIRQSKLH